MTMTQTNRHGNTMPDTSTPRETFSLKVFQPQAGSNVLRMSDRLSMLGIPEQEMTESVKLAVSALLEKLDDTTRELSSTKDELSEIERLVDVDVLAPIANRRAFMRRLTWAVAMHERYGHPTSVLYFDINDFSDINNTHGHAAGDAAIRHIAKLLTETKRDSDFLARIGGDEFALIMYHATEEAAAIRAKDFAEKMRAAPLNYNGTLIHISTAVGYYSIKKGDDAEAALTAADMSMYLDKKRIKTSRTNMRA